MNRDQDNQNPKEATVTEEAQTAGGEEEISAHDLSRLDRLAQLFPAAAAIAAEPCDFGRLGKRMARLVNRQGRLSPGQRQILERMLGRFIAFQVLFESDLVHHDPIEVLTRWLEQIPLGPEGEAFLRQLVNGVLSERARLDSAIQKAAPAWHLDDMSRVDVNLLRLSLYEAHVAQMTSPRVVVNEAIELAKDFGGDASARLINGVMATILGF